MNKIDLSIVLPVYNEAGNLKELHQKLDDVLKKTNKEYEMIFVDDCSKDGSDVVLEEIAQKDSNVKIIRFMRNFGQTTAIAAGFDHSQGEIIIPMDADLQNDPEDIPRFLEKINEGYDVVAGWRKKRQDKFLTKTLPSQIANKIISRITRVKLHDYGCTMKAYKKNMLEGFVLYGEMHRFIPAYTAINGAKVAEIETNHHPRKHGKTKYNLSKTFRVILDIVTVKFLASYLTRPMHFFGIIGFASFAGGLIAAVIAIYLRFASGLHLTKSPLLLFAVFLGITGIIFVLMGLLAEMMTRTYFESQNKKSYSIRKKINF